MFLIHGGLSFDTVAFTVNQNGVGIHNVLSFTVERRYHANPRLPSTSTMPEAIPTLFISHLLLLVWPVVRRAHHSNSPLGLLVVVVRRIGRPDNRLSHPRYRRNKLHRIVDYAPEPTTAHCYPVPRHRPRYHHSNAGLFLGLCNRTCSRHSPLSGVYTKLSVLALGSVGSHHHTMQRACQSRIV